MPQDTTDAALVTLTASIVAAYVAKNGIAPGEVGHLIESVHKALVRVQGHRPADTPQAEPQEARPAVSVKRSVTDEFIICLEDGKAFKSLKRHLRTRYNMTPEQYRQKWNLPHDYPMVAKNYAAARSKLAKQSGLGKRER